MSFATPTYCAFELTLGQEPSDTQDNIAEFGDAKEKVISCRLATKAKSCQKA